MTLSTCMMYFVLFLTLQLDIQRGGGCGGGGRRSVLQSLAERGCRVVVVFM